MEFGALFFFFFNFSIFRQNLIKLLRLALNSLCRAGRRASHLSLLSSYQDWRLYNQAQFLCGSGQTFSSWCLSTAEPVDVLEAWGVHRDQAGVAEGPGFCPLRIPQGDRAFRVGKSSLLSVPTWQLFPGELGQEGLGGGHPGRIYTV